MPLSHSQAQALPGNFSGSRKRTHAEITRSESRSESPHPPSKRRRTILSPHPLRSSSPESTTYSSIGARYPGDGLDYRRPVMSTASTAQQQSQETIDLTLEDDFTPPLWPTAFPTLGHDSNNSTNHGMQATGSQDGTTYGPFGRIDNLQTQPVIDLSSDDDDDDDDEAAIYGEGGTRLVPSSPEVQFMGERPLPQPTRQNSGSRRRPHLPTPPAMRGRFTNMGDFIRGMTQNMFVSLRGAHEIPEEALNRIDGLFNHPALGGGLDQPPDFILDEYEGIQMDYGRTAFNMGGGELLLIDDHNMPHVGPNRVNESAYKEPAPAREGFTRNYEEDDMLICGLCGDELATGKTEQKQQVWIIKQCGHAYCGDCACNRNISKNKNNRDSKRMASKKTNGFKVCAVPECRKAVDITLCIKCQIDDQTLGTQADDLMRTR